MIDPNDCPENLKESIRAYVEGRPTGGFLQAVLENDLSLAVYRADSYNRNFLPEITAFVHGTVPINMRGSKAEVTAHLAKERTRT